jgi:allantoicase
VVACSDEFFPPASNLLRHGSPTRTRMVHPDDWYDGWETRRYNIEVFDWAIIKLGLGLDSGTMTGIEIDTSFFAMNYAPHISVERQYIDITTESAIGDITEMLARKSAVRLEAGRGDNSEIYPCATQHVS